MFVGAYIQHIAPGLGDRHVDISPPAALSPLSHCMVRSVNSGRDMVLYPAGHVVDRELPYVVCDIQNSMIYIINIFIFITYSKELLNIYKEFTNASDDRAWVQYAAQFTGQLDIVPSYATTQSDNTGYVILHQQ